VESLPESALKRVGRNRFIEPLAAHHLLDVADELPGVVIATEKPRPAVGQWRNKAIAPYALVGELFTRPHAEERPPMSGLPDIGI
jgi:hypothetical protein